MVLDPAAWTPQIAPEPMHTPRAMRSIRLLSQPGKTRHAGSPLPSGRWRRTTRRPADLERVHVRWGDAVRLYRGSLELPGNGAPSQMGAIRTSGLGPFTDGKAQIVSGHTFYSVVEFLDLVRGEALIGYGNWSRAGSKPSLTNWNWHRRSGCDRSSARAGRSKPSWSTGRNCIPTDVARIVCAGSDGGDSGVHLSMNLPATLSLKHRQVVLALQVQPEARAVAKVTAKPQRRVSSDRPASVQDLGDATGRYTKVKCESVGAQAAGFELALEQSARMRNRIHFRNLPTHYDGR